MQRMISLLILLLCLSLLPVTPAVAWLFDDDTLVTIDGAEFTTDDFKKWWEFWREGDEPLPKTPQYYIDWLLLKQEGERMDLASDIGFKRQERVFLQSRGLLLLKYEEVDSKIEVTEAMIKARYDEKYAPRWFIQRLRFQSEEAALAAWQEISNGSATVEELIARDAETSGFMGFGEGWMRPKDIDPGWVEVFKQTEIGGIVNPEAHGKGRMLYHVKDLQDGDSEDLTKFSEEIKRDLWKSEEDRLTAQLLEDLKDEYQVKIDEERLAALQLNGPDDSFTDAPVITASKENVSEKQFMAVVRKLIQTRPKALAAVNDESLAEDFKLETANNIINQSVTNWASVDRHFEKKEPFKSSYEFNYGHRLVLMLEQRLFSSADEISDAEIESYFQENIKRYTVPAQAELFIVAENQGPIDKIWADVAVGQPFMQVVKQYIGRSIKPVEAPVNHLDPEVKEVVKKLVDGETSQIFTAQGDRVIVHLVKRTPEQPLPLARMKDSIRSSIKRKNFNEARDEYLNALKSRTQIEVKERRWQSLQKELGGA